MKQSKKNNLISLAVVGGFAALFAAGGLYYYFAGDQSKNHDDPRIRDFISGLAASQPAHNEELPAPEASQPASEVPQQQTYSFRSPEGMVFTVHCGTATLKPSYEFTLPSGTRYTADYNQGYQDDIEYNGYRGNPYILPKSVRSDDVQNWKDLTLNVTGAPMTFDLDGEAYTLDTGTVTEENFCRY